MCGTLAADPRNRATHYPEGLGPVSKDDEATHEARIYLKAAADFYQSAITATETHGTVDGQLLTQVSFI